MPLVYGSLLNLPEELYGLESDFYFDERRDPVKSTRAAAQTFKGFDTSLGDWYLALASYNAVKEELPEQLGKPKDNSFWDIHNYLPKETRNYVPQYIAVCLIAMNPEKYGFTNIDYHKPYDYETYNVDGAIDLKFLYLRKYCI